MCDGHPFGTVGYLEGVPRSDDPIAWLQRRFDGQIKERKWSDRIRLRVRNLNVRMTRRLTGRTGLADRVVRMQLQKGQLATCVTMNEGCIIARSIRSDRQDAPRPDQQ